MIHSKSVRSLIVVTAILGMGCNLLVPRARSGSAGAGGSGPAANPAPVSLHQPSKAPIQINPAIRHQKIRRGLIEVAAFIGSVVPHLKSVFPQYQAPLLNRAVNELGIQHLRLELHSGSENSRDYWQEFYDEKIDYNTWRSVRYSIENDNSDPRQIHAAGFHFSQLDQTIETIVKPMKKLVEANGEKLHVNLCYVDFKGSPFEHSSSKNEYAEFMEAAFLHIKNKYGGSFVPNGVEIILEPDIAIGWATLPQNLIGVRIGEALEATGRRLARHGITPEFSAPSVLAAQNAVPYLNQLLSVPGAIDFLTTVTYHTYAGRNNTQRRLILDWAEKYNKPTHMSEKTGAGVDQLLDELIVAKAETFTRLGLAAPAAQATGGDMYRIDRNQSPPAIYFDKEVQLFAQYSKHIRQGATRIEASSRDTALRPVAFINKDGKYVVVVQSRGASDILIGNLPGGSYNVTYAVPHSQITGIPLPKANILTGQDLKTKIPAEGVITIHQM